MIIRKVLVLVLFLGLPFLWTSCLNDDGGVTQQEQLQQDIVTIDSYLTSKGINAVKDPSGVRMVIDSIGGGLPSSFTTPVTVQYTGRLLSDGSVFETGTTKPTAPTGFIAGWQVALTTLPEGTKATVYIPSVWAYGPNGQEKIPANSILVFSIIVKKVTRTTDYYKKIATDSVAIDNYLTAKGITTAVKDSTGIRYVITTVGTGNKPTWYNKIKFKYTLKTLADDSKVIETNTLEPNTEFYSRVVDYIDGLKIGFQQIQEGTKATFYIPSGLAYGPSTSSAIPANSILIFEIELIDIVE